MDRYNSHRGFADGTRDFRLARRWLARRTAASPPIGAASATLPEFGGAAPLPPAAPATRAHLRGSPKPALAGLALAATLLLWGTAFPAIRAALRSYDPAHLAVGRFLVASLVMAALAPMLKIRRPRLADAAALAVAGLLGITLYHLLLNTGELTVTAGSASMVVSIMPPLTALLAVCFLGDRLGPTGWGGMGLSLLGVALIAIGDAEGLALDPGVGLIALGAVAFAGENIIGKVLLRRYTPAEFTAYTIWAGTLFLLPFSPGLAQGVRGASAEATASMLYLGAFPAALGTVGWSYVLRAWSASVASASLLLIPVVATLVGWLWLGEVPAGIALAGGAITLTGVVMVRRTTPPVGSTEPSSFPKHGRIPCRS